MVGTRVQASATERNARELASALRAVRRVAMLAKRQGDAGRRLINLELRNLRAEVVPVRWDEESFDWVEVSS